ncbi:hypothetical protein OH76DRAFT_1483358 [Lentinus brumalis]|uniref:Uncharacterized protein n=1 Tax=Lentinus brumalis TaxID=2498619 RepID=A0A371D9G4_9APHY|nr:hypothetical protein OH76DRAFT_1483358 [Polyporus brumalis]
MPVTLAQYECPAYASSQVTAEGTSGGSIVTELTGPITAILISRFLLDLQEANQTVIRLDPDDPLHSSRNLSDTPSFIASLGGIINPDFQARLDDGLESHSGSLRFDIEDGSEIASASSLST